MTIVMIPTETKLQRRISMKCNVFAPIMNAWIRNETNKRRSNYMEIDVKCFPRKNQVERWIYALATVFILLHLSFEIIYENIRWITNDEIYHEMNASKKTNSNREIRKMQWNNNNNSGGSKMWGFQEVCRNGNGSSSRKKTWNKIGKRYAMYINLVYSTITWSRW